MPDQIDELVARSKPHPELSKFHAFHTANPEVLAFLVQEARLYLASGEGGFSFANLWNYARWVLRLKPTVGGSSTPKFNDHMTPFYGRAILILCPDLNGKAELRGKRLMQGRSRVDVIFGTKIARTKLAEDYGRRLVWAEGKALEDGWRPSGAYKPTLVAARKPRLHTD